MFGVSVRRTSAGLSRPGWRWSRSAWPTRELDRVGPGVDERVDRLLHVLDAGEHRGLAGHPVVDRDVEAAPRARVEEAVEAVLLHEGGDTSGLQMLVAGPNLTIDRTAALAELRPGEVLRFERVVVTPGGKGLNVARAARALGHPALLVSLVPGHIGRAAAALIAEEGIELSGVPCAGELRSTMIVQERGGRTTVLNEPGPTVDERRWADYENAVRGRLTSRSVLVCSGSVPPGAPADAYGRLTQIAHGAGARAIVDAAGSTLLRALDAAPDLVTPNLAEAEGVAGARDGGARRWRAARTPGRARSRPPRRCCGRERERRS